MYWQKEVETAKESQAYRTPRKRIRYVVSPSQLIAPGASVESSLHSWMDTVPTTFCCCRLIVTITPSAFSV